MEIIYEIRDSIRRSEALVTKDDNSRFVIMRVQGTLADLYPNHVSVDPNYEQVKLREVKTGVLLMVYMFCYFMLLVLLCVVTGILGWPAMYISFPVICVVLCSNVFKINQSIKVKKLEKHAFIKYETKRTVALGYLLLCFVLMLPYQDMISAGSGKEQSYKTGSQAKVFKYKIVYILILIILQSMMQTYFVLSNLNFQIRRGIIVDCSVPRIINVVDNKCELHYPLDHNVVYGTNQVVTMEMISNLYETKLARTSFQEYLTFTSYYDSVIVVEGLAMLIVIILLSISFTQDGFLGPMDTAALCSCFISVFSTYYVSYQHKRLNTVITKQMKYITLHFNGLLDRIGFDEMKLLISAIITVILTIVLKS